MSDSTTPDRNPSPAEAGALPPAQDEGEAVAELRERIAAARAARTPLRIAGGDTKAFYGRRTEHALLPVAGHRGIVSYQPTELVLTARGGTPLAEVEQALAEKGQMLPFEPPHFGAASTLGGAVAAGLSGPRRPYAGAVRDLVLGVRILNGKGEAVHFGGQVMKNVAGYDVSRLMAGSLGTLGVLLEISLKVLPRPAHEETLAFEMDANAAIRRMNELAGRPYPLSGACHHAGVLYLRLSGTAGGVRSAGEKLGGESLEDADFWTRLRDQAHPFFAGEAPLWRLSLPAAAAVDLPGGFLTDWGGAQRWYRGDADAAAVRAAAERAGGHATLFRHGDRGGEVFHPLAPAMLRLHRRLKSAFDPDGVLNPGRMYAEI